jgi:hypothetical protein
MSIHVHLHVGASRARAVCEGDQDPADDRCLLPQPKSYLTGIASILEEFDEIIGLPRKLSPSEVTFTRAQL